MSRTVWLKLAAYGKLPLSREFVGINNGSRRARAFADFLHESAAHLAKLPIEPRDAFRVYAPLDNGRALAAASLWPSADEGGMRRFPFSFFGILAGDETPPATAGFFTSFRAMHASHERLFDEAAGLESAAELEEHLRGETEPVPSFGIDATKAQERFRSNAETYPTGRWAAALYGVEARRFLVALWRFLRLAQAAGGSYASLLRDHCGVRVPLVKGHALETQADAWLGLLAAAQRQPLMPSILLGRFGPEETASLCLFFRPLQPADLALLANEPVRGLVDLSQHKEPADMEGFLAFCETIRVRVQGSHTTLATLPAILEE